MRSGHAARRAGVSSWASTALHVATLASAGFFFATLGPTNAAAQAASVVCAEPHDAELVARVTGQTRDLPLRLQWLELAIDLQPSATQLAAAARSYAADFVVAIRADATGGHTVYVYDAKLNALRTRRAPKPTRERLSSSAVAETVALIVRGELTAALASEHEAEAPPRSEAPSSTAPPDPDRTSPTQSARPPHPPARPVPEPAAEPTAPQLSAADPFASAFAGPVALSIAAGMRAGLPIAGHVFVSPALALQLQLAHVGFAVWGSTSFNAHVAEDSLRIALRRHALSAAVFGSFHLAETVELALGPAVGVAFNERETVAIAASWTKTDDQTKRTLTLSAFADVRWRFAHRVGLSVRAGLDFPLESLVFTYRPVAEQSAVRELARVARCEPWGVASVFVDIAE